MNIQQTLYERDFYAWTMEQVDLLKQKKYDQADFDNIIEELESLGKEEKRSLRNAIKQLIAHLLQMAFQPTKNDTNQNISYQATRPSLEAGIDYQRVEISVLLLQMPSLKNCLKDHEWIATTWKLGVSLACKETLLPKSIFPQSPIWSIDEILDENFYPNLKMDNHLLP